MAALRLSSPTDGAAPAGLSSFDAATAQLVEHDDSVLVPALKVLRQLIRNVVQNPKNEKYRTVKVANKALEKKLWPLAGTRELLVSLGFVGMLVDDESVLMCLDVNLEAFSAALEFIESRMPAPSSPQPPPSSTTPPPASDAPRSSSSRAGAAEPVGISAEEVARRQVAMRAVEADRREQRKRAVQEFGSDHKGKQRAKSPTGKMSGGGGAGGGGGGG
eukprot:CAMPEP_0182559438 /NCGR_PEP_ID=MMETSP1324-20130603/2560_1 /TAXON_ID=236786 /ORGANISM="Florenciella sp., Strain RCC1587" /LENGTH=217 /DNA_ID=CAMNT_0024771697 /DNA_START=22 /DNA_END=671 /DNA_ORIENTATION=+